MTRDEQTAGNAKLTGRRCRCAFYTMRRWELNWFRFPTHKNLLAPRGRYDDPARDFDAILTIGPLNWRIYREVLRGPAAPKTESPE